MNRLKTLLTASLFTAAVFIAGTTTACKKGATEPPTKTEEPAPKVNPSVSGSITFDNYTNGVYTLQNAQSDFYPTVLSWKNNQSDIVDKSLRIRIPAGSVSGGFYPKFDIVDGTSYEVTFDIKFAKDFDWRDGGKLGVGFGIGDVVAGGNLPVGNGGSARIMWNRSGNNIIFKPYLYYTGMPTTYGTNVVSSAFYPQTGSLVSDTWYTIKMRVKSNTDYQANGSIRVKINNLEILNSNAINWGDNTNGKSNGWVKQLMFESFRGGQGPEWVSATDGYIFYDNIKVTKDPVEAF
jgi:hypothetical protein